MLAGMGFKVAAAPFHVWVPDVYEGAPTTVTAFMSVAAKTASFAVLARVLVMALPQLGAQWSGALALMAALTMLLGNIAAVMQTSLKRMLGVLGHSSRGLCPLGACRVHSRRPARHGGVFDHLPVHEHGSLCHHGLPCRVREKTGK